MRGILIFEVERVKHVGKEPVSSQSNGCGRCLGKREPICIILIFASLLYRYYEMKEGVGNVNLYF